MRFTYARVIWRDDARQREWFVDAAATSFITISRRHRRRSPARDGYHHTGDTSTISQASLRLSEWRIRIIAVLPISQVKSAGSRVGVRHACCRNTFPQAARYQGEVLGAEYSLAHNYTVSWRHDGGQSMKILFSIRHKR